MTEIIMTVSTIYYTDSSTMIYCITSTYGITRHTTGNFGAQDDNVWLDHGGCLWELPRQQELDPTLCRAQS